MPRKNSSKNRSAEAFTSVNMAALSSRLIESELFGHSKGSFTGAIEDREGWFEVCRQAAACFWMKSENWNQRSKSNCCACKLKLELWANWETNARKFEGKVISATNRNRAGNSHGRFRADVYYRLCSDQIHAPPPRGQGPRQTRRAPKTRLFPPPLSLPGRTRRHVRDVIEWIVKPSPKKLSLAR